MYRIFNCISLFTLRKSIANTKNKIEEANKEKKRLIDYKYTIQEYMEENHFFKKSYPYFLNYYFISLEYVGVNVTEYDERCFLLGGKLAEINNVDVWRFATLIILRKEFNNITLDNTKVFIGLELVNGDWKYRSDYSITDVFTYFNIKTKDPQKPCVYLYKSNMVASTCSDNSGEKVHYLCERPRGAEIRPK